MYLYVKTHPTGLKYLGKTVQDPNKYKGSGTHWLRHLNKHGEEHTTEILLETNDKEMFREKALYYSNLYNVVESKEWANIVPEQGDGGDTSMSPAYQEYIKRRDLSGEGNSFYGKKHTEETKRKISESRMGKGTGPRDNTNYLIANKGKNKGKTPWNAGKTGAQRKRTPEEMASFSKAITYQGVEYPSISAASRATGLSQYKIKIATSK